MTIRNRKNQKQQENGNNAEENEGIDDFIKISVKFCIIVKKYEGKVDNPSWRDKMPSKLYCRQGAESALLQRIPEYNNNVCRAVVSGVWTRIRPPVHAGRMTK